MKTRRILQVRYDKSGTILSATFVPQPRTDEGGRISSQPIPRTGVLADESKGHRMAELEVPDNFATLELHEIAEQLRIDVKSERAKLVTNKSAPAK